MASEELDPKMSSHDESDASSDSGSSSDDEAPRVEWLATGREKRSTAGNRMKSVIAHEEPDSDLELLFAEDENDVGFEEDAGALDSDVQMDSSSDDEDEQNAGADDLEGEKELERQAKEKKLAARKRKAQEAIPARFRKKVRIQPTANAAATAAPAPRLKKKSERLSWLPNPLDAPTRSSQRQTTRLSKEQLHQQMKEREARRLRQLATMEKKQKLLEAARKPPKTQADRLAEAALVEKKNAKSLNRWEEAEKQREEEQRAKLAALNNRTLQGPVITFWSGRGTGQFVTAAVEEKPKKKRLTKEEKAAEKEKMKAAKAKGKGKEADEGEKDGAKKEPETEVAAPVSAGQVSPTGPGQQTEPTSVTATPSKSAAVAEAKAAVPPVSVEEQADSKGNAPELSASTKPETSTPEPSPKAADANDSTMAPPSLPPTTTTPIDEPRPVLAGEDTEKTSNLALPASTTTDEHRLVPLENVTPKIDGIAPSSFPHATPVSEQSTSVAQHSASVDEHSKSVDKHSKSVDKHSTPVDEHSTPVNEHSTPINEPPIGPVEDAAPKSSMAPPSRPLSATINEPRLVPIEDVTTKSNLARPSLTPPLERGQSPSSVLAAPVLAPPNGITSPVLGGPSMFNTLPSTKSNILAPPNRTQRPSPLSFPPSTPDTTADFAKPPTSAKAPADGHHTRQPSTPHTPEVSTPKETKPPPPPEMTARNAIILQNFDEEVIKDKVIQTQILFGRKMSKLPSKIPFPPLTSSIYCLWRLRWFVSLT